MDAALAGVIGGMVGAKLLWVAEHAGEAPLLDLLLSRGGMSWFGGLAGGLLTAIGVMVRKRIPVLPTLAAATPALVIGHAIGRIGCFLVGDDYGRPTDLPWGVAFPEGLPPTTVPVHPTQIYEALSLVAVAWLLLRWRNERRPDTFVIGAYLILAGSIRFAIEFLRINDPVIGVLTVAHLASLSAAIIGALILIQRLWVPQT